MHFPKKTSQSGILGQPNWHYLDEGEVRHWQQGRPGRRRHNVPGPNPVTSTKRLAQSQSSLSVLFNIGSTAKQTNSSKTAISLAAASFPQTYIQEACCQAHWDHAVACHQQACRQFLCQANPAIIYISPEASQASFLVAWVNCGGGRNLWVGKWWSSVGMIGWSPCNLSTPSIRHSDLAPLSYE